MLTTLSGTSIPILDIRKRSEKIASIVMLQDKTELVSMIGRITYIEWEVLALNLRLNDSNIDICNAKSFRRL